MKSPSLHRCWIPIFKRHRGSYKHGLAKEPNKEKEKETDGNKESKKGKRRNIKSHGSNWESLTSSNRTRKQNSIGNPLPTSSSILRFASLFHREREEEEENENHRVALLLAIKNRLQMGWWDPSLGYLVVHKGLVPLVLLFRTWTLFHSNVFSFSYCSTTRKGNDWENEREREMSCSDTAVSQQPALSCRSDIAFPTASAGVMFHRLPPPSSSSLLSHTSLSAQLGSISPHNPLDHQTFTDLLIVWITGSTFLLEKKEKKKKISNKSD